LLAAALALTVGVTTASSTPATLTSVGPGPARTVAGSSKSVNPNNSITTGIRHVGVGETVVVSVATGTFAGDVGCSDNFGNTYFVRADKNTGNGRLFVCTSTITTELPGGTSTVTATYPGFSGTSVIHAIAVPNSVYSGQQSTGSGSNPQVSTGNITVGGPSLLVGVVANGNVSSFTPTPLSSWTQVGPSPPTPYFGGSGAGKRTLTTLSKDVGPGSYNLTGNLSGSGFWQAAVISLAAPPPCTAGSENFSGFAEGSTPATFSGGTIEGPYPANDNGGVFVQAPTGSWNGAYTDGTHVLFPGHTAGPFQLTFTNAVKTVTLDANLAHAGPQTITLTAYDDTNAVVDAADDTSADVNSLSHLFVFSTTTDRIKYFKISSTDGGGFGFSNISWTCNN
jgi:hypothetical protein